MIRPYSSVTSGGITWKGALTGGRARSPARPFQPRLLREHGLDFLLKAEHAFAADLSTWLVLRSTSHVCRS